MSKHQNDKGLRFLIVAIPAMILCCLLPILIIGGAFSLVTAWLADSSVVLVVLAVLAIAFVVLYRRSRFRAQKKKDDLAHFDRES